MDHFLKKPEKEKPKQNETPKLEQYQQKAVKAKRNETKQNKTPKLEHLKQKPEKEKLKRNKTNSKAGAISTKSWESKTK